MKNTLTSAQDFESRMRMLEAGLIPADAAFDAGTNTLGDVITQTADGRSLNDIWAEFNEALSMWNEDRSALVNALTFNVTAPVEDVPQSAFGDFEEASEFGVPKGIGGSSFFSLGYTFKWYDLAARFTWQFLAEADEAQVSSIANQAFEADNRNMFNKVLSTLFRNTNRTANINSQAYSVYALYNNDGTVPPKYANYTHASTHDHYLVSGGATVDSGDLDAMETHIKHHGYGPDSGSTMIMLVNEQEMATIRSFRIADGDSYDYIPRRGNEPFLLPANTGGASDQSIPAAVNGLPVEGAYGKWLIIENPYIPAGYLAGFATGGRNNISNPVGIREHAQGPLRGLRLVRGAIPDYPLVNSFYQRGMGTGIRHRGAAVITQVKASGSYDIPSMYSDIA